MKLVPIRKAIGLDFSAWRSMSLSFENAHAVPGNVRLFALIDIERKHRVIADARPWLVHFIAILAPIIKE